MKAMALVFAGLLAGASGGLSPAAPFPSSIGVYFDPDCTTNSRYVAMGEEFLLYVSVQLGTPSGGPFPEGNFTAAEFRISGIPANWWIMEVVPAPGVSTFGNVLNWGTFFFVDCQSGPDSCVHLAAIRILAVDNPANIHLQVQSPNDPGHCEWWCSCVRLRGCDDPYYTVHCAGGGEAWINSIPPTVGVAPAAWGVVKRLYQ